MVVAMNLRQKMWVLGAWGMLTAPALADNLDCRGSFRRQTKQWQFPAQKFHLFQRRKFAQSKSHQRSG